MLKILAILIAFCSTSFADGPDTYAYTIGPMLHYNFSYAGPFHNKLTYTIEGAYYFSDQSLISLNAGIEFDAIAYRLYSEAQFGFGLFGTSVGPMLEINRNNPDLPFISAGLQGTTWACFIGGADYRWRHNRWRHKIREFEHAVGIFGKYVHPVGSWY